MSTLLDRLLKHYKIPHCLETKQGDRIVMISEPDDSGARAAVRVLACSACSSTARSRLRAQCCGCSSSGAPQCAWAPAHRNRLAGCTHCPEVRARLVRLAGFRQCGDIRWDCRQVVNRLVEDDAPTMCRRQLRPSSRANACPASGGRSAMLTPLSEPTLHPLPPQAMNCVTYIACCLQHCSKPSSTKRARWSEGIRLAVSWTRIGPLAHAAHRGRDFSAIHVSFTALRLPHCGCRALSASVRAAARV